MDFKQFLNENSKPMGFSVDKTKKVAEAYAKAISKIHAEKCTVNTRTLEEDSFDLDFAGEEFDGGSYTIHSNGDVINNALPGNPVYGKWNDSVDTIIKNIKKLDESKVNEGFISEIDLLAQEAKNFKEFLKAFKTDNRYKGLDTAGDVKEFEAWLQSIYDSAKENMDESKVNEGKANIKKGSIVIPFASSDGEFIIDTVFKNKDGEVSYTGEFKKTGKKMEYILHKDDKIIKESVVNEGAMSDIDIIAQEAKDFKSFVKEFKKEYKNMDAGNPRELEAWLQSIYDSAKESMDESVVNERNITIKRQYTENHPATTVGKAAKVRNRMLEAIKDGKISQEEFDNLLKEMTTDSKRWLRRNAQCFNVSEDGITLSKTGSRILKNVMVAEATTKAPKIWVPGEFDKAISKYSNHKITRKIVLDAALKFDVNPEEAISYVEYGWAIDLKENNNNNMKTKFIYESFQEFVENKLNEGTLNEGTLNEAFASAKLASLLTGANSMPKDLPRAFYQMSKLALDKIQDIDIIEMHPETAKKEKRAKAVYLYFTTNEKENPYARGNFGSHKMIPSNTLLAITDGQNEWMNAEWTRDGRGRTLKVTKRDDSAGIAKSSANADYGTGISSMKQVADLADRAYCLDLDILRARYSTSELTSQRADAKRGATAFQNDKDFKAENKSRYNTILAQKASELPIDKVVLDAIEQLSDQIKDALAKGEKGRYDELIMGLDPKGREVKLSDASNLMRNILDDYQRYVGEIAASEKEVLSGYSGTYYENSLKQRSKSIIDNVKKIENKNYAW